MPLSHDDTYIIERFIELQIRFCLENDSPTQRAIEYLLALADSGSKDVAHKLATCDLDVLVADHLIHPAKILQNRSHIITSDECMTDDERLIKLHIRLSIIQYLKEHLNSKHDLTEIEQNFKGKTAEIERNLWKEMYELKIRNKIQLLKTFVAVYHSLQRNTTFEKALFRAADWTYGLCFAATIYLFYNYGRVFLDNNATNLDNVANLLFENVWPAFSYPFFSFSVHGILAAGYGYFAGKSQKDLKEAQSLKIMSYHDSASELLKEAREKLPKLEKELKYYEQLQQESKTTFSACAGYQEIAAVLIQNGGTQSLSQQENIMENDKEDQKWIINSTPPIATIPAITNQTEDLMLEEVSNAFNKTF